MYRITAINDDSDVEDEDENQVTKEAEETIAVSEYMRALKFKKENRIDDALSLLNELLETQVLIEITKDHKKKALFSVKYNCYKTIGFINESKGKRKEALEFLLMALELDDTEVYMMNKLGQLALSLQQLDIAHMAFEKCLKKNPNHWPSGDGILQILCQREDFNEAYGWALLWYDKNANYERGLNVILEIREKFNGFGLEYMENCWSIKFKDKALQRKNQKSVFPEPSFPEPEILEKPSIDHFKVENLDNFSWLTIGKLIVDMYEHFEKENNGSAIAFDFEFNDLLLTKTVTDEVPMDVKNEENSCSETMISESNATDVDTAMLLEEKQENSNSNPNSGKFLVPTTDTTGANSTEASADDSDAASKEPGTSDVVSRTKQSRRRGSDLQFLEQWRYWDRNRKYSQRQKNKLIERNDVDSTINGILRKTLPKYFEENFDNELLFQPGTDAVQSNDDMICEDSKPLLNNDNASGELFEENNSHLFESFMNDIKKSGFSLIKLVLKWPQYISKCWEQIMPQEILDLYIKMYTFYLNHYDLCTWGLLDVQDFQAAFRMTLFYLEISHERDLAKADSESKNEVDMQWFRLFNHLILLSGFYEHCDDEVETSKYQKRLYWLQYLLARYEYDLNRSVNCLCAIRDLLNVHHDEYKLVLPNQIHNNKIDMKTIETLIVLLERTIRLSTVRQLYAEKKFNELIPILKDSLINTTATKDAECTVLKIGTQFEVILECFWSLELFEECLVWSERCLKYALDCFVESPKDSCRQIDWAKFVTFILTYIEALLINEGYMIVSCLEKYYSRLIQSIVRIVSHQLDSVFDKNNNQLHPINIKMPWVILHHILQREEDMAPQPKRKLSTDSNNSDTTCDDEGEDIIPKSIMIFFTAHDYLGNRGWCTKDQGKLLLYTLDVVVPRLRTPYLEPVRDIIAEYLEQITYCLYGYPAKRARLKHIEEHDAQNVDLTWNHAIQLYDLYRPDELPEFNSYKNDSITSEMEQLLQRIVALIPTEIDPNSHCSNMEKFISGEIANLPSGLDILPHQMNSIFYLLADHYFKNRDFSKSVKYYVLDLSNFPRRFDSWAGLALSKASILETKLNSCVTLSTNEMIQQSEEVLRCFKQCLQIDNQTVLLWIEYGNYAYALHSYCSRSLKQSSATLSMERFEFLEEKKEECLRVAYDCFITVDESKIPALLNGEVDGVIKIEEDSHDEKWLYHYMLGKVAEKRKEPTNVVIDHYLKSAQYLYEHNATYPFKIVFTNPQNLSLEALEIFYRATAAIIKYVEQHSTITRGIGKYFIKVLKQLSTSPFAMSQAKINENSINAFKRKLSLANEEAAKNKLAKLDPSTVSNNEETPTTIATVDNTTTNAANINLEAEAVVVVTDMPTDAKPEPTVAENLQITIDKPNEEKEKEKVKDKSEINPIPNQAVVNVIAEDNINSPLRRGSQESTATTTTQTTTTTGTDSTSSSSSDSSSSDSSSSDSDDSSTDDGANKDENAPLSENNIELIYKMCIKNLEECVTRFPEHYKSIYRLVLIYLNAPERIKDLRKCKQLLLGTYTTALGNQVQGLFSDRKNNNLFNGIWRNPSSEIDRPGSFSSHLSKCVSILMQILRKNVDYKMLLELVLHLQRTPEVDKRYIKDSERIELLEQAMSFCSQSFKDLLKQHSTDKRDDNELLSLIVEIYKAHKKCLKHIAQKETIFSALMVDTYKVYIQGKVDRLPENINVMDLAVKLCLHEMNAKKNQDKQQFGVVKRLSLDELGIGGLSSVLPKNNNSFSGPSTSVSCASTSFTNNIVQVTKVTTSSTTLVTTSTIPIMPSTGSTSTYIPGLSRPRGRPPGSKNVNNFSAQSSIASSNFNPARVDPSAFSSLLSLYSNPAFMSAVSQFTDPTSLNTFLTEYIKITNLGVTPQLMAGLPNSFASPTYQQSTTTTMTTKPPKMEQTIPKGTSAMSVTPVSVSKSMSANSNVPLKVNSSNSSQSTMSSSKQHTISSSAANAFKSGTSTVISVGSGQLTITPSISITPQTTTILPSQMQPGSNQPKQKKSIDNKRKSNNSPSTALPSKIYQGLPSKPKMSLDLPNSLSIIPTSGGYSSKSTHSSKPFVTLQHEKAPKSMKPKKKTNISNSNLQVNPSSSHAPSFPYGGLGLADMSANDLNNQLALFNQYKELFQSGATGNKSYMSQFEHFLTSPASIQNPTISKQKSIQKSSATAPASNNNNPPKGMISVKQLESLQAARPAKPTQSSATMTKQSFPKPNISNKIVPSSSNSVLNPFATSYTSMVHSSHKNPYQSSMPHTGAPPNNNQISPTKTLQQKLAERQKALSDANQQSNINSSRPSSTSSAGSSKTRKSDTEVIILD